MLKSRITELLPGRVLTDDRRGIREIVTQNHLGSVGFTTECPTHGIKGLFHHFNAIHKKIFFKGIIA